MSTRIWSFLPTDMHFVPTHEKIEVAVTWVRTAMPAYKVEVIDHGKIAFFDCGGNMGTTFCPRCRTDQSAEEWSEWMTHDYDEAEGFKFSTRKMSCCGASVSLHEIVFETPCMFGRFGIAVTDTLKTYSDCEIENIATGLERLLGCPIRLLEARY